MEFNFSPSTINAAMAVVIGGLILAVWIDAYRGPLAFWLSCLAARLPVFGSIAQMGSNPDMATLYNPDRSQLITAAEARFAQPWLHLPAYSEGQFENRMAWLRKALDHDVPVTGAPLLLTVVIIFGYIEAYMIPWVLGPYLKSGIDQATVRLMATLMGAAIAVIFYAAAHQAGVWARRARSLAPHIIAWRRAGRPHPEGPALITPDMDQRLDDGAPRHEQFRARAHPSVSLTVPIIIMATLLLVGFIVTGVRLIDLQREESRLALQTGVGALDHVLELLGSTLTTVVLLLLYTAVQLMGFMHGYRHAFNSPLSRAVWDELQNQATLGGYQRLRNARLAKVGHLFNTLQERQAAPERPRAPSFREVLALIEEEQQEAHGYQEARAAINRLRHGRPEEGTPEGVLPRPTPTPRPGGVVS